MLQNEIIESDLSDKLNVDNMKMANSFPFVTVQNLPTVLDNIFNFFVHSINIVQTSVVFVVYISF